MGVPPGWSAAEFAAYKASVPEPTTWDLDIHVMTLDHSHLFSARPEGLDGQVNIDVTAEVDWTLQLGMLNLDGALSVDLGVNVAPRRLIQVLHGTYVPALGKKLWQPVFTGRPSSIEDDGDTLTIEAQGKECLHLRGVPAATIKKGRFIVDVIRDGLAATGEKHLLIPSHSVIRTRVPHDTAIGGDDPDRRPWLVWKRLAAAAGCQLYTTPGGWFVMRRWPNAVSFEWDERTVLSQPKMTTDMTTLRNAWIGYGKGTLRGSATATGEFSPQALAIGTVPWANYEFEARNDALTTQAEVAARGRARLAQLITLATDVQANVVPFHSSHPMDMLRVKTPDETSTFVLRQASIPLVGQSDTGEDGWPMTLGYQRRVRNGAAGRIHTSGTRKPKRRHRKHRRHHR